MQAVSSAGKQATGATNGGKKCSWYKARENIQPVSSAGKHKTDTTKGGKTVAADAKKRKNEKNQDQ